MVKLYRSDAHPNHWIAYSLETGWILFPARENGWESRRPVCGLDPVHLRQVPARLGFNTGLPEAPEILDTAA